jgi:FMN-dependent NADH-azoreductase
MLLFINACVRKDSRTRRLAERLLRGRDGEVKEVRPAELKLPRANERFLRRRDALLARGEFGYPLFDLARDFAAAEEIIVAAPYWDLSFPSALKAYLEQIMVNGVTFSYGPDGMPVGHCGAKRLIYVMTSGGPILPPNHGYAYVRDLAKVFLGIPETVLFSAELLDVEGMDVEEILRRTERQIDRWKKKACIA